MDGRLRGFRSAHTVLAMELLMLLALYAGCALAVKARWKTLAALAGAALTATLLFLTQTRSALLTLFYVTVPVMLILLGRFGPARRRVLAACLWLALAAPAATATWWYTASGERRDLTNASSRLQAWSVALKIAARVPWHRQLIGSGPCPGVFPRTAREQGLNVRTKEDGGGEVLTHAHNVFLQTLVASGIIGTVALVTMWAAGLRLALGAWRAGGAVSGPLAGVAALALLTWAALSQMDYGLYPLAGPLGWLSMGLGVACGPMAEEERLRSPASD
jgi:O-antigen ligase